MGLSDVIRPHFRHFSEKVVDPVSLASRLPSLRNHDREVIQCQTKSCGRPFGVKRLYDAIIGKVMWPELFAALREEKLTELAKILQEEYYQQHPTARPSAQDENFSPGINQCEPQPTDSSTSSNINDTARVNINILAEPCSSASSSTITNFENVKGVTFVFIAKTVNCQIGDNNRMNTNVNEKHDNTAVDTECEAQYDVCEESDVSKSPDKDESLENRLPNNSPGTGLCGILSTTPATLLNVVPQPSSSISDSQDGSGPKVQFANETAENTSEKLVFEEKNSDEMVSSLYIACHDSTQAVSESHGLGGNYIENLGIILRKEVKQCGAGEEEEETELKKLIK